MRFCSLICVLMLGVLLAPLFLPHGIDAPAELTEPQASGLWDYVWLIFPLTCLASFLWARGRRRFHKRRLTTDTALWWARDSLALSPEERERVESSFCNWEC